MSVPFFLNKLPADAEYCQRGEFFREFIPGREDEFFSGIQVLDSRVIEKDLVRWTYESPREEFARFFEIKDFQESKKSGEALCSLSLFKMAGELSTTSKTFDVYLDGLRVWIEFFRTERTDQKLRVYVGDSAWDVLHRERFLDASDVDFVRMSTSSLYTEIGVLWRFLAFDDYRYPYVYIEETDGFVEQVNGKWTPMQKPDANGFTIEKFKVRTEIGDGFAHFGTQLSCLPPPEDRRESFPEDCPLVFWVDDYRLSDPLFIHRLSEYVQFLSPTLIRSPRRLPFTMESMLCAHFGRDEQRAVYHESLNLWTTLRERHPNLNFRYIDDHWLFHLTKILSVKMFINGIHAQELCPFVQKEGANWFVKRIYDNIISDGNTFQMIEKDEYGSPFGYPDSYWKQIMDYDLSKGDVVCLDLRFEE